MRRLWDAGLEVAQQVRDLPGVERALRSDLHTATAVLEARFVWGDRDHLAALRAAVGRFSTEERERFLAAKAAAAAERRARAGAAVCVRAPDLKEGRGGLRDFQLAALIARLHAAPTPSDAAGDEVLAGLTDPEVLAAWLGWRPAEAQALAEARAFLLEARTGLHELSELRGDRLDPTARPALAARFACEERGGRLATEVFMDRVYRAARWVDRALGRAVVRWRGRGAPAPRRRRLARGVAAEGEEVVFEPGRPQEPADLAELFRQAARTRRRVGPATCAVVDDAVASLGPERIRRDPRARRAFLELLAQPKGVAPLLRAMHDADYLGALLPEFAALECLAQSDPYHAYSVDEHTLAVLGALEGEAPPEVGGEGILPPSPGPEDALREELLHRTERRELLRLGALLHDAGKVGGAVGHVERGLALVPAVARRFELSAEDERHVAFLVREHLSLSRAAEKLDVEQESTVEAVLDSVDGSLLRLEHLYLLTCADVRGVGPGTLTRWKDALLTRLYERARERLLGTEAPLRPTTPEEWVARLAPEDPATLRQHLARCGPDYLAAVEEDELLAHAELATAVEGGASCALRRALDPEAERVWVVARDRPGLLADLCGAFTGAGADLLEVTTLARSDGLVFDRFTLAPAESERRGAERWERVARTVRDVAEGGVDPAELVASRIRSAPPRGSAPEAAVRLRLSDEEVPGQTLLDVSAPDRVGLLYDLARAIAAAGCSVRFARAATKGARAVDVFHLSGPDGGPVRGPTRRALLAGVARAARGAEPPSRRAPPLG